MDTRKLDKILELRKCGLTLRDIGVVVKMSPQGVSNAIKKYGNKNKGRKNK